jgi:dephospho-CoA kinase
VITVGVTGGLGAGKSTACELLRAKGAYIFDADQVAKQILFESPEVQAEISGSLGIDLVKDGQVDTQRLAEVAFSNEENQRILNDILHPRVIYAFRKTVDEMAGKVDIFIVDAPLIFESGFDNHLDHTVLIYTQLKNRLARAMRRGRLSREEILRRIELQMPEEDKRELASFVIENDGTEEELKVAVDRLYDELIG